VAIVLESSLLPLPDGLEARPSQFISLDLRAMPSQLVPLDFSVQHGRMIRENKKIF
jgi:hypothetical protein